MERPGIDKTVHLLLLNEWNFLFLTSALLTLIAIQLLSRVKEAGEAQKDIVVRIMRTRFGKPDSNGLLTARYFFTAPAAF